MQFLGEELKETSDSYWRAAERAREAGLYNEAIALSDCAHDLRRREIASIGLTLLIGLGWAVWTGEILSAFWRGLTGQ